MSLIRSIYNLFKNTPPPPPQKRPLLIFGRQLYDWDGFLFDNVLPWASDTIPNTEINISDLIFLWVISRLGQDFHSYPTHLARNYGITKPLEQVQKLINLGLVDNGFTITELGIECIDKNYKFIELHKNGWTTPEEKKYNKESDKLFTKKYAEWLLEIGLTDEGNKVLTNLEFENKRNECFEIFHKGEMLGKSKNYKESNLILLPLLENDFVDFYAPLYERIAKNYRGLKEYQNEIDICQKFLNDLQPLYGTDMWVDVFTNRIKFATSHIK